MHISLTWQAFTLDLTNTISRTSSKLIPANKVGRAGGTRTPNPRIWNPPLYQLELLPSCHADLLCSRTLFPRKLSGEQERRGACWHHGVPGRTYRQSRTYSMILLTTPAPTVLPPSRIAKRKPSFMAIGWISVTLIFALSPGMHMSAPTTSVFPVTSVVRK